MFDDAEASYGVGINLVRVGSGWDDMSAGIGKFSSAVDGIAGKLAGLGKMAVFGAGAAAIGAITWGVASLGAEAEKAQISIGTIFSANGMAASVPAGITMAADTIAKMRIDAQKLPGEFDDLRNIFTTGAISAFRSGATVDQWRQISAKAMAASAVAGLPMDMAARELAQLIDGRAGAHNVLGMRLMGLGGQKAQEFNKMDAGARMAMISTELDKYSGAIDAFSHSWEGLTSTFIDNVKNFTRTATGPLFDSVKDTLGEINDWFNANSGQVTQWATVMGLRIQYAFEWGKAKIIEWAPLVMNFVDVAETRLKALWEEVQPAVEAFAKWMKDALADPNGTIDKMVHLAELLIGMRVAGGIAGAFASGSGGVGGALSGASSVRQSMGVGLATAGVGGALVGAGSDRPLGSLEQGAMATGGGAMLAGPIGAAVGAVAFAAASIVHYQDVKRQGEEEAIQQTWKFGQTLYDANAAINRFKEKHGEATTSFGEAAEQWAQKMEDSGNSSEAALLRLNASAIEAANALDNMSGRSLADIETKRIGDDVDRSYALGMIKQLHDARDEKNATDAKQNPKMKGGHGGTHVQKVEIVVTSNQNPSRIARQVVAHIAGLSTNRRSSRFTPNYSADEKG